MLSWYNFVSSQCMKGFEIMTRNEVEFYHQNPLKVSSVSGQLHKGRPREAHLLRQPVRLLSRLPYSIALAALFLIAPGVL
jgi:hypothetical protein